MGRKEGGWNGGREGGRREKGREEEKEYGMEGGIEGRKEGGKRIILGSKLAIFRLLCQQRAKAEQKPWDSNLRMDGEASQRSKNTQAEFCHTIAASRIVKPVPATCFQPNYASFGVCFPCALFKVSHRHFSGPCCEFFTTPS